ncbi:hypothetical protein D3C72_56520 [compost metagenome]
MKLQLIPMKQTALFFQNTVHEDTKNKRTKHRFYECFFFEKNHFSFTEKSIILKF